MSWSAGQRCFQSLRMRFFVVLRIQMEKVIKTLQYFWNHLIDLIKGFRPKTFPASLTGGL